MVQMDFNENGHARKRAKRQPGRRKHIYDIEFYASAGSGPVGDSCLSLCEFCTSSDFINVLQGQYDSVTVANFKASWHTSACPVCRLVRDVLMNDYGQEMVEEAMELEGFACQILARGPPSNDFYLCRGNVSDFRRLQVVLIQEDGSSSSLIADQASLTENGSFDHRKGLIDILSPRDEVNASEADQAMVRVPKQQNCPISLLQEWLSCCDGQHQHEESGSSERDRLQELASCGRFRLIDVTKCTVVTASHSSRYLALSYVWGKSMPRYAARHHRKRNSVSILNLAALPATVRDAMKVVRDLGEQYLWVDALCINQSDVEDKEVIIGAMSAVYGCAHLTIIAADGSDADTGLTRLHEDALVPHESVVMAMSHGLLPGRPSLAQALADTTWQTRAWTYQEHALSARCLYFTRDEVFFECSAEEFRECYVLVSMPKAQPAIPSERRYARKRPSGKRIDKRFRLAQRNALGLAQYAQFTHDYSRRQLTHAGDRLDAFKAILDKFTDDLVSEAQAVAESGIPLKFMCQALAWRRPSGLMMSDDEMSRIPVDARRGRCFPSWAWTGWAGQVEIPPGRLGRRKKHDHLKFKMLDGQNIMAEPTKANALWKPWPMQPSLCHSSEKGRVTLHLWAPVVKVQLRDYTACLSSFEMVYVGDKLHPDNGKLLGTAGVRRDYVQQRGDDAVYSVILWHKSSSNTMMLVDDVEGTSVRISLWTEDTIARRESDSELSFERFCALCSMQYIKLQ